MDTAATDDPVPPTSIEDEDTSSDVVNEPDVLAEVKLPFKVRKYFSISFCKCTYQLHMTFS